MTALKCWRCGYLNLNDLEATHCPACNSEYGHRPPKPGPTRAFYGPPDTRQITAEQAENRGGQPGQAVSVAVLPAGDDA